MKKAQLSLIGVFVLVGAIFAERAAAIPIDFASAANSSVTFTGAAGGTVVSFGSSIVTNDGTVGTVTIAPSNFVMGTTITSLGGGVSTTSISGSGTMTIQIGGDQLIGTFTPIDITQIGTLDGINVGGLLNVTDLSCTVGGCGDPLLSQFLPTFAEGGVASISFQFIGKQNNLAGLTGLAAGETRSTSFSGSIEPVALPPTAVPEPTSLLLLGSGLLGFGILCRKKLKEVKN